MKIKNALLVNQEIGSNRKMFVAAIPVEELIDETKFIVDEWKKELKDAPEKNGYQRAASINRVNKISKYIRDEDPIFATSILVNCRDGITLNFNPEGENKNVGELIVSKYPLYIIDGQHRIAGFRNAIEKNMVNKEAVLKIELPVVLFSGLDKYNEAIQFHTLNTTQKKIPTDLSQRFLQTTAYHEDDYEKGKLAGKEWQIRALELIDQINDDPKNVWYGKIKLPNSSVERYTTISQNSFLTSLAPLYKSGSFSIVSENGDLDKKLEIFNIFWSTLKEMLPSAFANTKYSVIQKTTGVFALNSVLNSILLVDNNPGNLESLTRRTIARFNEHHGQATDFWKTRDSMGNKNDQGASQYGSMKGFGILARQIVSCIPKDK